MALPVTATGLSFQFTGLITAIVLDEVLWRITLLAKCREDTLLLFISVVSFKEIRFWQSGRGQYSETSDVCQHFRQVYLGHSLLACAWILLFHSGKEGLLAI